MNFQKKIALWLVISGVGLLVLYFAVISPLLALVNPETPKEPIELLEGEGYYQNGNTVFLDQGVIYPTVSFSGMFTVVVHNTAGEEYVFWHNVSSAGDFFYLGEYAGESYDNGGNASFYAPEITDKFRGFDFTTLYDGQSKIPAMLTAVGNVLFNERVYIMPEGTEYSEYQEVLRRYGLAEDDNAPWIEMTPFAKDDNGNLIYYIADDTGNVTLYFYNPKDKKFYAGDGVELTQNGYTYDADYRYTGDVNLLSPFPEATEAKRLYVGRALPSGDGYYVRLAGRDVVYVVGSVKSELANIDLANLVEKDLSYYIEPNLMVLPNTVYDPFYSPHLGMYTGKEIPLGEGLTVGDTVYLKKADGTWFSHTLTNNPDDLLSLSLLSRSVGQTGVGLPTLSLAVMLGDGGDVTYTVTSIDAVLNAPYTAWTDGIVGEGALLKVTFETADGISRDGVISLLGEGLSSGQKALFVGQSTGACQISFTVEYTPALHFVFEEAKQGYLPITGLMQEGTTVYFSYYETDAAKAVSASVVLDLESTDGFVAALSRVLVGKSPKDITQTLTFAKDHCFAGEEVGDVAYGLEYSEDLSFAFYYYGTGKRDPYLADSIYQITGPEALTPYTIDSTTGQQVMEIFSSFKGANTVAVGLTPDVMQAYGLYARRLEYSLTYNTKPLEDAAGNITSITQDFRMDYCFYVSEAVDGYRYVGSEEYDIVVKIDANTLSFLDWDFLTRFARSNLLLMYTSDIKQIEFITNFSDSRAHHTFWLSLDPSYKYESSGETSLVERLYVMYLSGEAQTEAPYIADTLVAAKPGVGVEKLSDSDYRVTRLIGGTNLDEIFYNNGYTGRDRVDFMGVHYFRRMMTAVYSTRYIGKVSDDLSAAEISALTANENAKVMEIKVKLLDGRTYTYGFYAYSGQRMLVSLTGYSAGGEKIAESQLFYVNASEVKKIATFAHRLSQGEPVHEDEIY